MSGADWRLIAADCLGSDGLAALADGSVDHVICDPPYEAESHNKGRRILKNPRTKTICAAPLSFAKISEAEREASAREFARLARRWIVVFSQLEGTMKWRAALEAGGARYIRTMIWVKPNGQPQLTGDRPGVGYECIVVAHSAERTRWNGGGKLGWIEQAVDANFSRTPREHETQKPLPLMERLVRDFTDPGELILDPFAGSGTTGVACIRNGRRFIGFERDQRYAEIARKRIGAAREQLGLFAGGLR